MGLEFKKGNKEDTVKDQVKDIQLALCEIYELILQQEGADRNG